MLVYSSVFFNIRRQKTIKNKSIFFSSKKSKHIMQLLLYVYINHILIKQNKSSIRSQLKAQKLQTILVGLWAVDKVGKFLKTGNFIKYLYQYYRHSIGHVLRYYN